MFPTTKSVSLAFFGLLMLVAACTSSSDGPARDGGSDALNAGGSGGRSPVGGSSGGAGGLAAGGAGVSGGKNTGGNVGSGGASTGVTGGRGTAGENGGGGKSTGGGGTSTGGNAGNAGQRTAGNTGSGGKTTGGSTSTGGNAGNAGQRTAGNLASSATSSGVGGTSAAGSTSSGGSQTGGSGGSANVDGGPDATLDSAQPDSPADLAQNPDTGGNNMTLEACFANLPSPVGLQMVATKQSSDNRVRIRIALDTEDRFGTSGSYAWGLIRLAVEVDGAVTCIKDRASLKYMASHHNCSDSATATSGSTTYSLGAPDRSSTSITMTDNGTSKGTWTVTDTACTMGDGSRACQSGGPC